MNPFKYWYLIIVINFLMVSLVFAQVEPIRYHFTASTALENNVTVEGAGFGALPIAEVKFGCSIPTCNAFEGATDGIGMIITADPGEGVMVLTQPIQTTNCALLRCSVQASGLNASIYLASVGRGKDVYVSTITPNNPSSFVGRYNRIADFFLPPSTGFQGILQIVNTSDTDSLTVYVDNFEILEMGSDRIELDVSELIAIESETQSTPTATASPTPIPSTVIVELPNFPDGAQPLTMV